MSPRFAGARLGGRLSAFQTGVVRWRGLFARDSVGLDGFGRRRLPRGPLVFEGLQRAARIQARRAPDKHNHLPKLGGGELWRDLIDAALVQQQDGGDYILDTRTLQAFLGHRSINSTTRYAALAPGRFKNIWGKG